MIASVKNGSFRTGVLLWLACQPLAGAAADRPADLVLQHAKIYTAAGPELARALAVKSGKIVFVGDDAAAVDFIGPATRVIGVRGRLVVPGLVDSHIHPLDIVDFGECDLDSAARTLRQIAQFVHDCVKKYRVRPGQWLAVHQWASSNGNQPDATYPTLRAALDRAAPHNPVHLLGDDGHTGAFNSAALALARNRAGKVVGIDKQSLAKDFADVAHLVGVDATGEPSGIVNEAAQALIDPAHAHYDVDLHKLLRAPQLVSARLNRAGITAVLDAAVAPEGLPIYRKLLKSGQMSFRATLAQYWDPGDFRREDGGVDYDAIVAKARVVRAAYAKNALLRADFVKLFADGVAEGNPFAAPPMLGNAAMLRPYLQPVFVKDKDGHASVSGYVETNSALCQSVRDRPQDFASAAAIASFRDQHGFYPAQCRIVYGQLAYDRSVLLEFVKRLHLAGFSLHIHVIGDRAVRTAIDAIEAARAADGNATTHDSLAHAQFVHPDDIARIGRDGLYIAYTFWWASAGLDYEMTLAPFLEKVVGNAYASRHVTGTDYEEYTYPVRLTKDAGAIIVGGSDAPVGSRDPQPFVNISTAITRQAPGEMVFNARQALTVREALDAYTIDGARFLGRDRDFGSIETGKSADFVVLDRDIFELADGGKAADIAKTRVLETWFRGTRVYRAAVHADSTVPASGPQLK